MSSATLDAPSLAPSAPAPRSAPSALDRLKNLAAAKPATHGKPKQPTASLPEIDAHIERFIEAKKNVDHWTSIKQTEEAQVSAAAAAARIDACRGDGELHASIRLNDRLTYTQQCRYCAVPLDESRLGEMKVAFGADYGRYFSDALKIELTPRAAADETVLSALLETFGDRFASLFAIRRVVTPTKEFHHDLTLRAEVHQAAKPFLDDETIKPYKASLVP